MQIKGEIENLTIEARLGQSPKLTIEIDAATAPDVLHKMLLYSQVKEMDTKRMTFEIKTKGE